MTESAQLEQTDVNTGRTQSTSGTRLTQSCSGPVRYELVSYRGEIFGSYGTISEAREAARHKWPDQSQDEDRTGEGWDVQVAGVK
jgi:hypothetical protein